MTAQIPHYRSYSTYELTQEQQVAVHLASTHRENIKINALAGTGKTSTLRAIALNLPKQSFLYLAFNKSVQVEASQSFPRNVTARTIHSLAYRAMRVHELEPWQKKLKVSATLKDYANFLQKKVSLKSIVCLKEAMREFQNSSDERPSSQHIPSQALIGIKSEEKNWIMNFVDEEAPRLWKSMISFEEGSFPINHDTYLKLWQLSNPRISGVDVIMLDEAQDANPVMIDIIQKQKIRFILVGDTWQQIYSFRGAVNAMRNLETKHVCYLTQSFRFGQTIADLANEVLSLRLAPKKIRGFERKESYIGPLVQRVQYTVLFRYNISLLEEAIDLASKGLKIHVLGSLEHTIAAVMDVYYLFIKAKKKIKNPKIRSFKNWSELELNFDIIDDVEFRKSIRFVEKYKFETSALIASVERAAVSLPEKSDVILATAHKSKGREWDYVRLSEDFRDAVRSFEEEELNLLYVAMTRAIKGLELSPLLLEWLDLAKKKKARKDVSRIPSYKEPNSEVYFDGGQC